MGHFFKGIIILLAIFIQSAASQTIETDVRTYKILEGDNLLVICNITDSPDVDVYWSKSDNSYQHEGRRLEFIGIKRSDRGRYKCHAIKPSPDVNGTYINVTAEVIDVDVQYAAEITTFDVTPGELLENESFTITCEMQGNPDPTWVILNGDTGKIVSDIPIAGRAIIGPMNASCDDAGYWECTGRNLLNNGVNVTKGQNLRVNCPPRPLNNNNYTVTVLYLGQTIELLMEVKASPKPMFIWSRFDGKELSPNTIQRDSENKSILQFHNVTVSDFGEYMLKVENDYGTYKASFQLIPDGPPVRPTNLHFSDVTDNSVTLYWTSSYDMGTPQHFYVVKLFNANEFESISEWIYDNSTNHGINGIWAYVQTGLKSNTFYNLSLVAENENTQKHYWSGLVWPPVTFWTKGSSPENSTPSPSASASSINVALFVGISLGVSGSLLSFIFLLYVIWYRIKRASYVPFNARSGNDESSTPILKK